jgi:predicted ATPase/class 3 adenylate cyclase
VNENRYLMPRASGAKERAKSLVTLPTGTVTFLFTDIEGSTQRWDAHREVMKTAIARHDALMRQASEQHHGFVFKTVGDAFCVAFGRPEDAIAAALDAQRALNAEDFSSVEGLRVRMALHTGTADERDGDYFGPAVNRVARLLSIGSGGQILVSGASRGLLRSDMQTDTTLTDLGSHRLKDLAETEHVWQLSASGLQQEFPALRSLDASPNNLPLHLTSFRGRELDLAEVKSLINQHRLLTLSGAGGIGKTRLAVQVAADLVEGYPDGVWFVDLASLSDPELVASVVAKVVGMNQVEGSRVDEAIPRWLKRKQLLLILDNCEHVIERVAPLAAAILSTAAGVRILATSRQTLGIGGEFVYRLPSLTLPETDAELSASTASAYGAIALFVDRVTASESRFVLNDTNAPVVAEICRRLDGIPLAIELAAARVKVLSLPKLAQRLDERFKLLTGGSRTLLPRQQTLSALIAWSYDLLTPQERTLFDRAGVFAGGFSLDAVTAVCAGDGIDKSDIVDLLSSLTDKSLLVADTAREQERYRMLESTRSYALDRLTAAGERERLARRHGLHFRDQAQAADLRFGHGSTAAWLANVEVELDNYRAVLEWALTGGHDVALGGAVAGSLERLWRDGGLTVEGRYWIGRAQASLDETANPLVAARLWGASAMLSMGKSKHDQAKRALALYESAGDKRGNAWALYTLGVSLIQMGNLKEASRTNTRALAAMREAGDEWGAAACLSSQAFIHWESDIVAARELFGQALASFKALGDEGGTAIVLANLAEMEFADGRVEQALRLTTEALEILARGKNVTNLAIGYNNTAAYRIALGDVDGADKAAREGLRWARQAQSALHIAMTLQQLALLGALRRQAHNAARLIGYVDRQYKELGSERESTEQMGYKKLMAALQEQLSDREMEMLAAEGAAWSEDQAVEAVLQAEG